MTGPEAAEGPIRVTEGAGGWTYVWDHPRKPHLHPVATPSGLVLTQVEPEDHPWQRGLWFAVKFVDGDNFWEEYDPGGWGVQRHDGPPSVDSSGGVTTVEGDLSWLRPDGTTVAVREHRRLRHVPLGDSAYAIDWDVTLANPGPEPSVLDRSPYNGLWGGYSGLAFRGRSDWTDTRLLLDDGTEHERVAPHRSRWLDLSGPTVPTGPDGPDARAGGNGAGGVCVLDHPANASFPVPFYATCRAGLGYGEGWSNTVYPSFLWDGPATLDPGEPLRFRYRAVVHDGVWGADRADAAWADFAGAD